MTVTAQISESSVLAFKASVGQKCSESAAAAWDSGVARTGWHWHCRAGSTVTVGVGDSLRGPAAAAATGTARTSLPVSRCVQRRHRLARSDPLTR
eukprot:3341936-Rhodomonas_salina.2